MATPSCSNHKSNGAGCKSRHSAISRSEGSGAERKALLSHFLVNGGILKAESGLSKDRDEGFIYVMLVIANIK